MALTRRDNGEYVLKSQKQLKSALALMQELAEDISTIEKEQGIDEMRQDATELKRAATRYAVENGIEKIQLEGDQYAVLVRAGHNRRWLLNDNEIERSMPKGTKSLRSILKKKFPSKPKFVQVWKRVTKRVPDPEGIQECIDEGLLTEKEIAAAFVEDEKAPFLRIYGSNE